MCPVKVARKRNILAYWAEGHLLGGQEGVERAWKQDPREAAESWAAGI